MNEVKNPTNSYSSITDRKNSTSGVNDPSKTPAVRRRSSVGSLMLTATDDLVDVSKPKFKCGDEMGLLLNSNDCNVGVDDGSQNSPRRRRSRRGSSPPSPATAGGSARRASISASPRQSGKLFYTIDDDSARWGAEDLEVLRLLLRTVHTCSATCPSKRLLPSSGVAARALLRGTNAYALDAPASSVRTRVTLGNLRGILGSQPHYDHVRINSPRSVTVVLRSGFQCDELIRQLSDMLNDRTPSELLKLEAKQLLAKLEFEYRALCGAISRVDAVDFLRAPTVPDEATLPTAAEMTMNFVEATKRRGLMRLARHQHDTEKIWNAEQQRIQKEQMVAERLRQRADELEARKQRARIQNSLNDLERNKPIVPYHKQDGQHDRQRHLDIFSGSDIDNVTSCSSSSDDDDDDDDNANDDDDDRNPLLGAEAARKLRRQERRTQRLIEARRSYSSSRGGRRRGTTTSPSGVATTSERVDKVRAAREAMERRRLAQALQQEAVRQEQVRICDDRKQRRFQQIASNRAAHNSRVRNAVTSTRRAFEFEQIRRIAEIEHEEARALIRKEQQQRMRERLREQIRVAQHLDLEAQVVIEKGMVTLGQSLEKFRTATATITSTSANTTGRDPFENMLTMPQYQQQQQAQAVPQQQHAILAMEESQQAMMRLAQSEAKLEKRWKSLL